MLGAPVHGRETVVEIAQRARDRDGADRKFAFQRVGLSLDLGQAPRHPGRGARQVRSCRQSCHRESAWPGATRILFGARRQSDRIVPRLPLVAPRYTCRAAT
jgi:hypothetical protein